MATPEGRVKERVKRVIKQLGGYYFMPVQNGMGAPALDFMHIQVPGVPVFAIETKAPGKSLTVRQERTVASIRAAGGTVFVVDGPESLDEVKKWLLENQSFPPRTG